MGVSDRHARQKASLKRQILQAASRLLVEEGYHAVTMRKLAARIEYSPTTIYLYFTDKHELLAAVCDETFSELAAKLDRARQSSNTPLDRLRGALRTYIEFGLSHPAHYAATFLDPDASLEPRQPNDVTGKAVLAAITRLVAAGVEQGALRAGDVELTAQALWAAIHGVTALLITQKSIPLGPQKALIERAIATLIAGVQAPGVSLPPSLVPEPTPVPRPMSRPVPSRDFSFMD